MMRISSHIIPAILIATGMVILSMFTIPKQIRSSIDELTSGEQSDQFVAKEHRGSINQLDWVVDSNLICYFGGEKSKLVRVEDLKEISHPNQDSVYDRLFSSIKQEMGSWYSPCELQDNEAIRIAAAYNYEKETGSFVNYVPAITINQASLESTIQNYTKMERDAIRIFIIAHEFYHHQHEDHFVNSISDIRYYNMRRELLADEAAARMVAKLTNVGIGFFDRIASFFLDFQDTHSHPGRPYRVLAARHAWLEEKMGISPEPFFQTDEPITKKVDGQTYRYKRKVTQQNGYQQIFSSIWKCDLRLGTCYPDDGVYQEKYVRNYSNGKREKIYFYGQRTSAGMSGQVITKHEIQDPHGGAERTSLHLGYWRDNQRSTSGRERSSQYYADGKFYHGEFLKGEFNGQGVLIYPEGNSFLLAEGTFKNGKRDGTITIYNHDVKQGINFYRGQRTSLRQECWQEGKRITEGPCN